MRTVRPAPAAALAVAVLFALAWRVEGGPAPRHEEDLAAALSRAFRAAADRIAPCVVAIRVERTEDIAAFDPRRLPEELRKRLGDYYRRPDGPASGVIVGEGGAILTSWYNVAGKVRAIRVTTGDGRVHDARIVATDPWDDLALLAIEAKGLPVPRMADPGGLRVGEFVVAVGRSPDPARPTLNAGIISALRRKDGRLLQTDAAVNYGNAGGALVDLEGRLVGVIAFVGHRWPDWGLNGGVGLVVRVDAIGELLPTLQGGTSIPMPSFAFLGVAQDVAAVGVKGAKVATVVDGGGAKAAGLEPGDVIVAFDGALLEDWDDLVRHIFAHRPGDEVEIRVRRGEETISMKVKLGRRPM